MEDADHDPDDKFDALLAAVARMPSATWSPPSELDEYRMLRPLGRGGMGSVWLAEDRLLDRLVAIKFIAHGEPDRATRERFEVEARAAARLAHPNVVTVHRFGEVAGRPYLVAEYIQGQSLDELAKPVAWPRALELGTALARGLAAAHRSGIVHRDIKPSNAILASDGTVKLVDFGLAKLGGGDERASKPGLAKLGGGDERASKPGLAKLGGGDERANKSELAAGTGNVLTAPGSIAGTPLYLAPEVRAGEPADRRADVYQLGSVIYELLLGRAPRIDADADGRVLSLVGRLAPEASRLAAVIDRCLDVEPAGRYASGDELREALERLVTPAIRGELPEGNPYRGLLAFDAEHRALFFGRGTEIRAVIERLRADPFVLVTGDSGVGKSSLCRAGVLPNVVEGAFADGLSWTSVQLVPGHDPVLALASALAPFGVDEALLRERPGELVRELKRALGAQRGVLVFVDQLEELVTLADRDGARIAAAALGHLASGVSGVRLLATARGDFLARIAELPGVELARAVYVLRSLTTEGARDAIVGPARAKGGSFESEALIDALVASIADEHAIELPLLAFTLAQLWDERDDAQTITARSLDAIGGVRGALARHADGVLAALLPAQRAVARKLLLRLVTPERTRSRRSAAELAAFDPGVLDALVRARLVVVRGDDPPMYELAHERLIDGWPALAEWLSEANEELAIRARLAAAAANWERLARNKEVLWRDRQLADAAELGDLSVSEAAFVAASRRALGWRRVRLGASIAAIPLVAAAVWGGTQLLARRDLAEHIAANVGEAQRDEVIARLARGMSATLRATALRHFDRGETEAAETAWAAARTRSADADTYFVQAARSLEAAFLLDTTRDDVRRKLSAVTFERIELATREHHDAQRTDLVARLDVYDDGAFAARVHAPARVEVAITPAASVSIVDGTAERPLPPTLEPGAYTLIARAPGRALARIPVVLEAGDRLRLAFELPAASAIPDGFVYVPPGRYLTGSRDEEAMRLWYGAPPMHQLETGAYLIARTETTYRDWIAYLETLSPAGVAHRRPHIENMESVQLDSAIDVARDGATWRIHMSPASVAYTARLGESIRYTERTKRERQDWSRMPVTGVSPLDAEAYAAWLDRTGRVPHARLCTNREWERAARGADGRAYPNGERLALDDANIDVTYGRKEGGFGPDEVGSHPGSASPFGVLDMAGNVWEIVRTNGGTGYGMKGGTYWQSAHTAHLANESVVTAKLRHMHIGVRICADVP